MSCDLTGGRLKPCKDAVGGIRKIHFVDFNDLGTVTVVDDEVTDLSGTFSYHTYDVKGNSSLETNIQTSLENGTTFFEQVISVTLHKLTKEDNKELKLMAFGRPHICVVDYNGNAMLVGLEHGADVTGGTIATGAAMGDMSGYTLNFTGQELKPANFITGATAADPFAGMSSATVTIVVGTNS